MNMKLDTRTVLLSAALLAFIVLPLCIYALGDVPRRSALKESISVITLLAFFLMLGQFFLARSNEAVISHFKRRNIQLFHKYLAYTVLFLFLIHPLLVVFPRFFEAGVAPADALLIMLTSVDNLGVLLGEIAWLLMLCVGLTALFRRRLITRLHIDYRQWRYFHGYLTIAFVGLAIWHAIQTGRHTNEWMGAWMIALAASGAALLFRMYASTATTSSGAKQS